MWRQQWDRLLRALARLERVSRQQTNTSSDDAGDIAHAFFKECHSFKDWLKNDPVSAAVVGNVEAVIDASPDLCIAADLANGSKHLTLTSSRTGDKSTAIKGADINIEIDAGGTHTFRVESNAQTHEAYDLAVACVDAWRQHLTAVGLLP